MTFVIYVHFEALVNWTNTLKIHQAPPEQMLFKTGKGMNDIMLYGFLSFILFYFSLTDQTSAN